MIPYNDYLEATATILRQSQHEQFPYVTPVCGRRFIVGRNVFSPKYFRDTEIFAKNLVVKEGEHFLEAGPGCGAISITKVLEGAGRVVCIDRNIDAYRTTRANVIMYGLEEKIDVRHGNLYEPLIPEDKFHAIFWNVPFGLTHTPCDSELETAVFDPGYLALEQYIKDSPKHIFPGGRLLIGFSTTLGKLELIEKYCNETGYKLKLIHQEWSQEVYPVSFEIFEARS